VNGVDTRGLGAHLLRHPSAAPALTRAAWRLRRRAWWRRAPFLPVPGRGYWEFRLSTATGSPTGTTSVKEVIEYAEWSDLQRTRR
jgi:hypothetical protein